MTPEYRINTEKRIKEYFDNSGKLLLVPYTKDFRRITRF